MLKVRSPDLLALLLLSTSESYSWFVTDFFEFY